MFPFARPGCEALEARTLLSASPAAPPALPKAPAALLVDDINADGRDDLFLARADAEVVLMDRDGSGWSVLAGWRNGVRGPSALTLADVTGDGLPDLVVGNGAGDGVLVFPGLGGGEFGRELNGGAGFATGPLPGTFAAGYLGTESKSASLVVTRPEADEVVVMLGSGDGEVGMRIGQRLRTAAGPVAALLADVTGDGITDLIVTCRETDRIWVLAGLGGGRFDATPLAQLRTGDRPVRTVIGDFDGDRRPDLLSLDSGSHTLTLFRDVQSGNTAGVALPSGGLVPIDALVRDVNGDGSSDLIVANHADGNMALFLGGSAGLHLAETLSVPDLLPTALAASATDLDPWSFYAAGEGSDEVRLLRFEPVGLVEGEEEVDDPTADGPTTALAGDGGPVIDLQPLGRALAAVVPVVLSTDSEEESGADLAGTAARESGIGQTRAELAGRAEPEDGDAVHDEAPVAESEDVSLQQYLLGVDEVEAPQIGADGTAGEWEEGTEGWPAWPDEQPPGPEDRVRQMTAAAAEREAVAGDMLIRAEGGPARNPASNAGGSPWWRDDVLVQAIWALVAVRLARQRRPEVDANGRRHAGHR